MHNHSNGNELRSLMQIKLISLTIVEHLDSLVENETNSNSEMAHYMYFSVDLFNLLELILPKFEMLSVDNTISLLLFP